MKITEADFLTQVKALAFQYGWLVNHNQPTKSSRGAWITSGLSGFPDLTLCHKDRGFIQAELKSQTGRIRPEQITWLENANPWIECVIWRPADLPQIAERLGRNIDRRSG